MAAKFSVLLLTAAPPGQAAEAGGAFVKIDGREAMLRSIELFLNRDNVCQIQIAFLPEAAEDAKARHGPHLSFSGVRVVSGGPRWIDQIAASLPTLSEQATHVLLHDAARPALPYTDIEAIMEQAQTHPAAVLVTPMRTALLEVDEGSEPMALHSADQFVQLLTPQTFSRDRFVAMAGAKQLPHASELRLVKGSPLNVRLGGPGDVGLLKAMLSLMPRAKKTGPSNPFEEAQW